MIKILSHQGRVIRVDWLLCAIFELVYNCYSIYITFGHLLRNLRIIFRYISIKIITQVLGSGQIMS